LKFGYPAEPPTLDPMAAGGGSAATRDILRPILPALFRLDTRLRPRPDLVAAWPNAGDIEFDPFSVKLRLRRASWSDGKPISAEDVRFSLEKLRAGPTGYRYRFLRGVDVLATRSLVLRFDRVVRRWWSLFSLDDMVLPAHAYSPDWDRGPSVSGGPFAFAEWTDGLRVTLRRNDRYWGPKSVLKGIDVLFVPDDETRLQLMDRDVLHAFFAEGEINFGRRVRARGFDVTSRALSGGAEASGRWSPMWWELDLDAGRLGETLADAVVEAVDPALAREIFEDSGRRFDAIPSTFVGEPDDRAEQPWSGRGDLGEAKAILDRGGGTKQFQLAYPRASGAAALATFIHFRLKELGVRAELVGLEPESFERSWLPSKRAAGMLRLRRASDAVDASAYANLSGQAGAGPIDDLVTQAETTVAQSVVENRPVTGVDATPWLEAQRRLVDAATVAPLVRTKAWIVGNVGVIGPQPADALSGPFWNASVWQLT
jgi:ABC-type transport system substrate-binding protein